MSAVLALFNRHGDAVDKQHALAMLRASAHRAVDGQDLWADRAIILAQQRFWITPEEQGETQPLMDEAAGLTIVCDARLDNRETLKKTLHYEHNAAPSDAALILSAYRAWGTSCVKHLLGDFAFAVWDRREETLFFARDPLGVRDLCFHINSSWCLVASEVSQLLAHPAVSAKIDEQKVTDYLIGDWSDHKHSFFQAISYCPPAHFFLVSATRLTKQCYWDYDLDRTLHYQDERDYYDEFRELLKQVVQDRLRIAGHVGVSLSGGPDSATLAALLRQLQPGQKINSFSYIFDDYPACDERHYMQSVASYLDLHQVFIKGDDLRPLRHLQSWPVYRDFAGQDPFVRLPLAILKEARKADCRVIFNGHYSDVLFAGGKYHAIELLQHGKIKALLRDLTATSATVNMLRDVGRHAVRLLLPVQLLKLRQIIRPFTLTDRMAGLTPGLISRSHLVERQKAWRLSISSRGVMHSKHLRHAHLTWSIEGQGSSAFRSLSNANGIDVIDPFWDRRLIEYVLALPAYLLSRPPLSKWLLRQTMAGFLPDEVLFRPDKTSLYTFFADSLRTHERNTVNNLLHDPVIVQKGWIRKDWLEQQWQPDSWSDFGHPLWTCLCLELWLSRHLEAATPTAANNSISSGITME